MTLQQLIAHVGQENIQVQPLMPSIVDIRRTNFGSHVTFVTGSIDPAYVLAEPTAETRMGLILWVRKDALDAARAAYGTKDAHPL